jgi:uncharacterized glyoxalase superfamily protein PhnB
MKMVPIFRCGNMQEAIAFYTKILDFVLKNPYAGPSDWVVDLVNDTAELQLSILPGDQPFGIAVNVQVPDVDAIVEKYLKRGLDTSGKLNSPVHQGPVNQTWGKREFYVTDPNGNTLRFGMQIADS